MRFVPAATKEEHLAGAFAVDDAGLERLIRSLSAHVGDHADDESVKLSFTLRNSEGDQSIGLSVADVLNFPFGADDWDSFSIEAACGAGKNRAEYRSPSICVRFRNSAFRTVTVSVRHLGDNSATLRHIVSVIREYKCWFGFLYYRSVELLMAAMGGLSFAAVLFIVYMKVDPKVGAFPLATFSALSLLGTFYSRIRDAFFEAVSINIGSGEALHQRRVTVRRRVAAAIGGFVALVIGAYVTKAIA